MVKIMVPGLQFGVVLTGEGSSVHEAMQDLQVQIKEVWYPDGTVEPTKPVTVYLINDLLVSDFFDRN